MTPKKSKRSSHPSPSIMSNSEPIIDNLNAEQIEHLFVHTLQECNSLSKNTEVISREVAMAKMVNYCIRMLHSNSWHPRTVVRAMVHMEASFATGTERGVQGMMYQALREKRDEGRAKKGVRKAANGTDSGEHLIHVHQNDGANGVVDAQNEDANGCNGDHDVEIGADSANPTMKTPNSVENHVTTADNAEDAVECTEMYAAPAPMKDIVKAKSVKKDAVDAVKGVKV